MMPNDDCTHASTGPRFTSHSGLTKELAQIQSITAKQLRSVFFYGARVLAKEQEAFGLQFSATKQPSLNALAKELRTSKL